MSVQLQIALLISLFGAGFVARRLGWLKPPHAGRMLQLVMNVGLPALLVASISRIHLTRELLALPLSAVLISGLTLLLAAWVGRALALPRPAQGAMVICGMSINNSFLFVFVLAAWGGAAFAQLALFDLGNAIMQGTVLYATAAWYGGHGTGLVAILRRMAGFAPLWAVLLALLMNLFGWTLPDPVADALALGGRTILLLVVLALGVLFDVTLLRSARLVYTLVLRMVLGVLLAAVCVWAFGLQGSLQSVVLLGGLAPIGFSAVAIANREKLDRELAASAASLSVLLALAYVPLALWLLHPASG